MGWTDSRFPQFEAKGQLYGKPSRELERDLPMKDEACARLDQLLMREKDSMLYEYDFGDTWTHQIVLEKILAPAQRGKIPQCVDGARACPPEDCGGVFGYVELLKALKDPSHPEHEDMLEWIGQDYDPTFFDLEAVNKQLAPRKGV
jgi:pRiA4b ORF-3-like protein